jgi:hypothetical protein
MARGRGLLGGLLGVNSRLGVGIKEERKQWGRRRKETRASWNERSSLLIFGRSEGQEEEARPDSPEAGSSC